VTGVAFYRSEDVKLRYVTGLRINWVREPESRFIESHVRTTNLLGGVTYYGYDAASRASTVTDPERNTTYETL
jgi:YD repeat-containing protein